MSAPETDPKGWDEFDLIDRLFRPLAADAPEALGLTDDAALIPGRPGHELVVTADAIVAGVHFLEGDPLDLVARKLLRVNLSDIAAKGAVPYGYLLTIAWPHGQGRAGQAAFAVGLAQDQAAFGIKLFGGDTVSTPGPLTLSATMLGWVAAGAMIRRSGARAGDLVQVSGTIGDGMLGLRAARGELGEMDAGRLAFLADRYRLPSPRLDLREALSGATAAADVSDGLLADAGRIVAASGVGMEIDLDRLPLSAAASAWLNGQDDQAQALATLASGGDDYEIVCTAPAALPGFTVIGRVVAGEGLTVRHEGQGLAIAQRGYRHGKDG